MVTVRGNHCVLPRGSIGREFIDLLAEEIICLSRQSAFSVFNNIDHLSKLHRELNHNIEIQYQNLLKSVLPNFDDNKNRAVQQGIDGQTSVWLTVIPLAYHHFDLSATSGLTGTAISLTITTIASCV